MKFLILEWKSLFRSAHAGHSISIKIILSLFGLFMAIGLLSVGHSMYDLLDESSDSLFPMQQVNRFLVLWFIWELGLRFFMQQLPMMNVKPFLIQRISRSSLTHYLLGKSIFSFYNLLAPLLFIPFGMACWSAGDYSGLQIIGWIIAVLATSQAIHFFNFLLQRSLSSHSRLASVVIAVLALFVILDYFNILPVSRQITMFFEAVLLHPVLSLAPLLLVFIGYTLLHRSLRQRLYLENTTHRSKRSMETKNWYWIDQLGRYAPLIRLDLKLLWRNKRSKSLLMTGVFGLLYGLIFYPNPSTGSQTMFLFVGIFMTGLFTFNFGQFVPAWDSAYYPLVNTQRILIKDYLVAKSILLYGAILLSMILVVPYIYFGREIFMINIVAGFYNMGINVPIILYFGSFNKKRIDLGQSQFFNYQGMGAAQWIVMLPALIIPVILWSIIRVFANFEVTCIVFALIGIIGLCGRNLFVQGIAKRYQARKYTMLEGFKQVSE
ncbi:DUF5687 family protein [Sphingobacterium sp. lm-10]|uniref:DUF5687 family protein n=1 Tax=Sphingobacterium sp. lm-10 TaxID=2944904 RepID=UPI00201FF8C9|nr:DUF5687 family protein [Sphingobacterium sp. lm-10]MCL7987209.1 DUF5687 family protein [Sphingobacterium sp. lm-10]